MKNCSLSRDTVQGLRFQPNMQNSWKVWIVKIKVTSLFSVVHAHLHLEIPFNIGNSSIITEDKCFANNANLSSIILPEKSKQYF